MNIGLILLVIGGFIITFGDFSMKKWVGTNNYYFFALGICIYIAGSILLAFSFKYKNIAVASMIYIIINITFLTLLTYFYFKEPLGYKQIIGLILGLLSIIVMES